MWNIFIATNATSHNPDLSFQEWKATHKSSTVSYSLFQREHEASFKARQENAEKRLRNKGPLVKQALQRLAQTKSRAPNLELFTQYLTTRWKEEVLLAPIYQRPQYRIDRWYNWCDRRSSEDRVVQRLKETFGEDAIIAYGMGTGFSSKKYCRPSPTEHIRRIIAKNFTLIDVPEANTSNTCSHCHGKLTEDTDRTKNGRAPRGIRCCQSIECGGLRRWNRDYNAAINIAFNLVYYCSTGDWFFDDPATPPWKL